MPDRPHHDGSRPFKYSAEVHATEVNTSHAIVLDLVGTGKRVLDVGCATGYLAEALAAQGNKVSGVEIDGEAAESARPFLERLVVGDLEELDLVEELGAGEFDVVIFADVLEHLTDPAAVLRRSRPLLAEGGYAVVSIPNVAHGSVRLALLKGHFDYRPVGLLDDTHLRFFTRDQLERMLTEAGFLIVDGRQTTAGPFETEIPVDRADYPPETVAQVEADPESWVYQFVARIEPIGTSSGGDGEEVGRRSLELSRLRRTLAEIARLAGQGGARPVIGVLDPVTEDDADPAEAPLRALRQAVTVVELLRRLAGFEVRAFSLSAHPVLSEFGATTVESLAPWTDRSAADLASQLDALVVLPGPGEAAERMLEELGDAGLKMRHLPDGPSDPDPLVLVGRLVDGALLRQRREYLELTRQLPAGRPYTLVLSPHDDEDKGATVRPAGPLLPIDLLALVQSADAVRSDSTMVDAVVTGLCADAVPRAVAASGADRVFDQLHLELLDAAGPRLVQTVPQRLAALEGRLAALAAANAGLRRSLAHERWAMANALRRRADEPSGEGEWSSFHAERMSRELAAAHHHMSLLQAEIDRIYATRTMRMLAPARRAYGLFRRARRILPRRS